MALNKELILTLTCLKEVGVKGIGPKKIFSIANTIEDKNLVVDSFEELASVMLNMREKAIREVTLSNLIKANLYAIKMINLDNPPYITQANDFYFGNFKKVLTITLY